MRSKLTEHILGLIFVSIILLSVIFLFDFDSLQSRSPASSEAQMLGGVPITNVNDPFQQQLLQNVMDIYYPGQKNKNIKTVREIFRIREDQFNQKLQSSHVHEKLSFSKLLDLAGMYLKFLFIYAIVMVLTYYGVQTIAVWRFVSKRRLFEHRLAHEANPQKVPDRKFSRFAGSFLKVIAYMILFSPAYVIAYSIRTEFNTDSSIFMILLGLISNGLLVMYSNKFYAFLVAESRKGYVEAGLVKNLEYRYSCTTDRHGNPCGTIDWKSIVRPVKQFKGHIFDHIFRNAHYQYLSTIKEQASFLITGLIIIEMALNIHGYLNYEMLRQLLYKNYDIVLTIVLGIFYTVKFTEIITDFIVHRESLKYEN